MHACVCMCVQVYLWVQIFVYGAGGLLHSYPLPSPSLGSVPHPGPHSGGLSSAFSLLETTSLIVLPNSSPSSPPHNLSLPLSQLLFLLLWNSTWPINLRMGELVLAHSWRNRPSWWGSRGSKSLRQPSGKQRALDAYTQLDFLFMHQDSSPGGGAMHN